MYIHHDYMETIVDLYAAPLLCTKPAQAYSAAMLANIPPPAATTCGICGHIPGMRLTKVDGDPVLVETEPDGTLHLHALVL